VSTVNNDIIVAQRFIATRQVCAGVRKVLQQFVKKTYRFLLGKSMALHSLKNGICNVLLNRLNAKQLL